MKKRSFGFSLVELLVAIGLMAVFLPALLVAFVATREGKAQESQRLMATAWLRETREAVRSVRERGWTTISTNGTYHPTVSGSAWSLVAGSETQNGLTRQVVIADVYRNTAGVIVSTGGTLDPSTKKITYTISWVAPLSNSMTVTEYAQRNANTESQQTTQATFAAGVLTGVATQNTSGGEIVLAAGGYGDWCNPNLSIAALDLPKNGVANALSAIEGRVFAGTGENASGVSFANINVTDTEPPTSSILGTFDGYKTNGVFGEAPFAYLATDNNSKEVEILDLTRKDANNKYAEVGYFNAPGSTDADSVYVSGNIGFVTVDDKLYTFNLTSKSGSRPQLAVKTLAGTGTKVVVNGSYAYVSIAGATQELQIVQFNASGTSLNIVGYADVNGAAAYGVAVNSTGTRAYLATSRDSSKPEFFIINTSSKTGSRPVISSFDAAGMDPNGLAVATSNKVILVGSGGQEYQAIDISNETNPTKCGGLDINTGINGVATVAEADGDVYSYIITGDSASELKIIQGGPGGRFVLTGTYESSPVATTSAATFNRFVANVQQPANTSIKFQVAVAPASSGSCVGPNYTYVGTDGTPNTYFTGAGTSISGIVPIGSPINGYQNPGQCFRYKAYLDSTDVYQSPVLSDFTVNYSP